MRLLSLPLLLEGAALPSLSLGGVLGGATFSFSSVGVVPLGLPLWVVLRLALSPFAWCCLPSPPFGGAAFSLLFSWVLLCLLLLWAVLRFFPLLLRGAAFLSLLPWVGLVSLSLLCWVVLSTFSSFRWGCFPSLFCWLVQPSFPSSFG